MMHRLKPWLLAILVGILIGFSEPPFHTGYLALVAFIPFFLLFENVTSYKKAFLYSYLMVAVFHLIPCYWLPLTRDFYLALVAALFLLVNPVLYFIPVALWLFVKRRAGFRWSLFAFPWIWVSFEYFRSITELAGPIFTLGYTQTYSLDIIQIASIFGVYGISFWILSINVLLYVLLSNVFTKKWNLLSVHSGITICGVIVIFFAPKFYGNWILQSSDVHKNEGTSPVRIAIIQPNIDPYVKWKSPAEQQLNLLQTMTAEACREPVDLVVWPETAIPRYIFYSPEDLSFLNQIRHEVDSLRINLFTGTLDVMYFDPFLPVPKSAKWNASGQRYDIFNTALLLQPNHEEIQKHAKMILVPFAERIPYAEQILNVANLNFVRWNFGTVGLGAGTRQTIFSCTSRDSLPLRFSTVICFESIFPQLVSSFVRKGAQFIVILSNESWWGKTDGSFQHCQLDILRAIENRRWIVRCSNGGASCFIDPFGHILQLTPLDVATNIKCSIQPLDEITFYTKCGDWFAGICIATSLIIVLIAFVYRFKN